MIPNVEGQLLNDAPVHSSWKCRCGCEVKDSREVCPYCRTTREGQGAVRVGPFDVRAEVSADARYIAGRVVKHMWVILVLLPLIIVAVYIVGTAK